MIVVTGASGFVGRAVCDALTTRGHQVVTIGRSAAAQIRWPASGASFDAPALDLLRRSRAVVNLAGENIGARWTSARRRALRESRVDLTTILANAIAQVDPRPATLLNASAMGIYGNRGDEWLDETTPPAGDSLANLVRDWERATEPAAKAGVRVVKMRFGVVLGRGGILARLRLLFQLGLGGRLGSGRQWMSWVSIDDVVDFVLRAIDDSTYVDAVNVSSPEPVTNAEFTRLLGRLLGRPTVLPAPAFALRLAFGEMADRLLLTSHRMRPAKLLASRFSYAHPTAEGALRAALGT
jgi:uncharacterized protein (TIGR01777 family)